MSIEKDILKYLNINRSGSRFQGIKTGFLGLPDFEHYKYQSLANNCSILQKKGYIKKGVGGHFITQKGRDFLKSSKNILKKFEFEINKSAPKNLLVMYDIPQDRKVERDWFRFHLKKLNFIMVQKSVWAGPGPLPKEFVDYVKGIELGNNFKTFKLAKKYEQK